MGKSRPNRFKFVADHEPTPGGPRLSIDQENTMYVIDNIHAGRIEACNIPTLAAAVIEAAQYDGWGAEYARDIDGRMGLRCSRQHIGNNPFVATGEEKPAYGITSVAEDDGDAIAEVAARIAATEWGGNMKGLRVLREEDLLRERISDDE